MGMSIGFVLKVVCGILAAFHLYKMHRANRQGETSNVIYNGFNSVIFLIFALNL